MQRMTSGALAVFMAVSVPAFAHESEGGQEKSQMKEPEMLSERFLGKLEEHLKLSAAQKEKIKSILAELKPALQKSWERKRELMEKMKVLQKEMREAMRGVHERIRGELDAEQKEGFDDMMSHMRGRHRMMGPGKMDSEESERGHREGPRRIRPEGGDSSIPEMWHDKASMPSKGKAEEEKDGD